MLSLKIALLSLFALSYTPHQPKDAPDVAALKQFEKIRAAIEKDGKGVMDTPIAITGDINGDNRPDCIVSYVLTPKGGGNMIIGDGHYIYLNIGSGMKAAGKFPSFKFCYSLDAIKAGVIHVKKYKCAPPYNESDGVGKLVYKSSKIVEIK
ncbi:hypothetical protein [Mucilaginibacter myungsuensis]|uniref:Uncharacterized protein n=1 Tax=Mucilaginibacter myungsuensis TaxID=649104 RepID=A0A929L0I5_9SPHI|nr:hypothetical protein [Mucilaginibacter myungsuensis]MBE9664007.1 hypothetical protein [Mucilaginibacter myungsuensis]MDN3601186.1 hypothetical protein [Mucilaginibacter myungsuensis]